MAAPAGPFNPGSSVFDQLMNSTCQVLMKNTYGSNQDDGYGQPPQGFTVLIASHPCRWTVLVQGREYKTGKEYATKMVRVFMRPPLLDDNNNPFMLTTHHWLLLNNDPDPNPQDPSSYDTSLLNVTSVNDPSKLGHHLEVEGIQVYP